MKKVAIFHTTSATLEPLKQLASELMPNVPVLHMVEESMIKDVMQAGGVTAAIQSRILGYIENAQRGGCEIFMTACSSIGGAVERCQPFTTLQLCRIDTAMIEQALQQGNKIAVLATVETTLTPTLESIERLAAQRHCEIQLSSHLEAPAYEALLSGDQTTHNHLVEQAVATAAAKNDVVLLAQASMANAISDPSAYPATILTSPKLGMTALARVCR